MTEKELILVGTWVGAWLFAIVLLLAAVFSVNYRLNETHLMITVLGIPVRRIRIRDIRHMGTEPKIWAERWYNTLLPSSRRLVIRRKRGLVFRTLIITPKNPYIIMHDLEKAKERLKSMEAGSRRAEVSRV